jgi:hypothetical protein
VYGGIVHLVQVAVGGWPPYRWAPAWLAIYFTSLTVFDPLAAWLLVQRLVIGLYLTACVLVGQGFSIVPGDVSQTRGLPHVRARGLQHHERNIVKIMVRVLRVLRVRRPTVVGHEP